MTSRLLVFTQRGCDHCGEQKAILRKFKPPVGLKIEIIDCDRSKAASKQCDVYKIDSTPTLILEQDGLVLWKRERVLELKELERMCG